MPGGATMGAHLRFVGHAYLAEPDPARKAFEEAVAFRQRTQRRSCPRRQQAEVARVLRYGVARAEIEQAIEQSDREPAGGALALAVGFGPIDHAEIRRASCR